MTTEELHEILDNPNHKLTVKELQQVIYELKNDVTQESYKYIETERISTDRNYSYYSGEANAFMICLDLLEHLEMEQGRELKDLCKECIHNKVCYAKIVDPKTASMLLSYCEFREVEK